MRKRNVFYISDGTGITAETLGRSLLTQFENVEFEQFTYPHIDNAEKIRRVVERINQCSQEDNNLPIVFATLANPELLAQLKQCNGKFFDFLGAFIEPLELELGVKSSHSIGRSHSTRNANYLLRIEAMNFAMACDDGSNTKDYGIADFILLGVSRCGKTPTSIYLAMHFGMFTANYPFTEEDLQHLQLPAGLSAQRSKLFGLTIDPRRLQQIRSERRPNSRYSDLKQCEKEVKAIESLYRIEQIPYLDITNRSIEEMAADILDAAGVQRRFRNSN